jgi:hypothetical protein
MSNPNFAALVTEIEKAIPGQEAYELANLIALPSYKLSKKDLVAIAGNIVADELATQQALQHDL